MLHLILSLFLTPSGEELAKPILIDKVTNEIYEGQHVWLVKVLHCTVAPTVLDELYSGKKQRVGDVFSKGKLIISLSNKDWFVGKVIVTSDEKATVLQSPNKNTSEWFVTDLRIKSVHNVWVLVYQRAETWKNNSEFSINDIKITAYIRKENY